jgi:HAE1 family hydrophobic/amphiphilic exporter-1/multidrug efflux pump
MFVKNNMGQLIQMDNVVTIEEKNPSQLYHNNRYMAAISCRSCSGQSISDGIDAERNKSKVLDDTFTTDWVRIGFC